MRRRVAVVVILSLATVLAVAAPASAISAFGPPATVIASPCSFIFADGDAALGPDGLTRGFATYNGPGCPFQIWYFQGSGSSWTRQLSPYRGVVLGVAVDGADTYLLYAASDGVRITKRTRAGFTPGRRLSPVGLGGATVPTGDVIAIGGTWWAVWDEPVGPGGEFAQHELFQAKTYGTDRSRQRITFDPRWDTAATLARRSGGGAVLAWERNDGARGEVSDLRIATSVNGAWSSRAFATLGNLNTQPDLFTTGTTTFIAWIRDGRAVEADNGSGVFKSHTFATAASFRPRVASSFGKVFVIWTTPGGRTFAAERSGSVWTGTYLSDPGRTGLAVTARRGKATVLMLSRLRLFARTQV
ncbi:MAG TPA: hypothetical protein VGR06_30430 [Actinophytocola sp.]|jgi:hypothetical protein|uniref:hypothetical protein n=1 Tax=Actinophytocola sp. TaxID=1872138 RepID=UPI002DFC3EE3|nr:hypothetical protein [Actinophytocola sp.]